MEKAKEERKELFHYTTKGGLEGILSTQTLYATYYEHLNDSEEVVRFKPVFKNYGMEKLLNKKTEWVRLGWLSEVAARKGENFIRICNQQVDSMIATMYEIMLSTVEPFMCSFCSSENNHEILQNGLLSQWRGYSSQGGFAIVFNAKRLEALLRKEEETMAYVPLLWGDVVYEGEAMRLKEELGDSINLLCDYLVEIIEQKKCGQDRSGVAKEKKFNSFARCISLYKHKGFKEEKEFRIVGFKPTDDAITRAKAEGSTDKRQVPRLRKTEKGKKFVELFVSQKAKLPIKRIIVGPQRDKEKIAEELRTKYEGFEVTVSSIPYIGQIWAD